MKKPVRGKRLQGFVTLARWRRPLRACGWTKMESGMQLNDVSILEDVRILRSGDVRYVFSLYGKGRARCLRYLTTEQPWIVAVALTAEANQFIQFIHMPNR